MRRIPLPVAAQSAGSSLAGGPIRTDHTVSTGFPRQTPMLAGRVAAEGPYGWHGKSKTLEARLLLGFGLHRWFGSKTGGWGGDDNAHAVATFLREGLVPPPRPIRALTEQEGSRSPRGTSTPSSMISPSPSPRRSARAIGRR